MHPYAQDPQAGWWADLYPEQGGPSPYTDGQWWADAPAMAAVPAFQCFPYYGIPAYGGCTIPLLTFGKRLMPEEFPGLVESRLDISGTQFKVY